LSIKHGFAFSKEPAKPSSGDGASVESKFDPNTGERNPSYKTPTPSPAPDTTGANGGLGQSSAGAADLKAYRVAQQQYSGVKPGGGAGFGSTIKGDSDDKFTSTGSIPADSARQPMTTSAGSDELVIRTGGADDQTDTGQSGGREISY
jgi:hypothetical protein